MKGWERDLLDHLVWLTLTYEEGRVSRDEVVAELKREFPRLVRVSALDRRAVAEDLPRR